METHITSVFILSDRQKWEIAANCLKNHLCLPATLKQILNRVYAQKALDI